MAKNYRSSRSLAVLAVSIVVLLLWAFIPQGSKAPKLGLDLRGGTQVILSPQAAGGVAVTPDQLAQTIAIIRARVDGFGVSESEVTTQGQGGNAKIIISIPGKTSRSLVDQLKTTAVLNFRPVVTYDLGSPQPTASPTPTASKSGSKASPAPKKTATPKPQPKPSVAPSLLVPPIQSAKLDKTFANRFSALDCAKSTILEGGKIDDPTKYLVTCSKNGAEKFILAPAALSGTDIQNAQATLPQQGAGGWQVDLTMTTGGAKKFADVTKQLAAQKEPQNQFAIALDGIVESAPRVNEAILGGSAQITGTFTAEEAKGLAQVLKFGALPVSLSVDEVQQISPTLGNDQLKAGILAGLFGLLLVIVYLLLYYRALGVVAVLSLIVAALMSYLLFVILGHQIKFTLSLPGIAGAIVAIGITADSFIIYFERIRDELREGKRLRSACDHGWERARRTLLAADFVSFLAAVVLYFLSVGSVRGFAFTLGLTTLIDIAVAFLFTRPVVHRLADSKWMNAGSSLTGVSPTRLGARVVSEATN